MQERKKEKSVMLTQKFKEYYPGGHSNLRISVMESTKHKVFIDRARGSHMWDVDGNEYIEFAGALGPTILGNCNEEYVESMAENMRRYPTIVGSNLLFSEDDITAAEKIIKYVPCAEQLKFCVTGSEAVQMAFRIARAYTGKTKIVRFVEHYHGWFDNVLGGLIRMNDDGEYELYDDPENDDHYSLGTSPYAKDEVIVIPWNDFAALERVFEKHNEEIAIIHFEAVVCNTFGLYPKPGFVEKIRELCTKYNVVMSMDEVITGVRTGMGGIQKILGVTPDICTMGKAIAGGVPISLVAGKKEIMSKTLAKRSVLGPGTFNGWNLGMHAITTTYRILEENDGQAYKNMLKLQEKLTQGIVEIADKYGKSVRVTELPGIINTLFGAKGGRQKAYVLDDLEGMDMEFMNEYRYRLHEEGLLLMPGFRWYMSIAHTDEDIDFTLEKMDKVMREMTEEGL